MNKELTDFLNRHDANSGIVARLNSLGAETLADAWDKASPKDLVWGVTRPGVMSAEQRRLFLMMVLESIEDKLTDPRSKNILDKLRTKSPITRADAEDAYAAADAEASWAASWAAASWAASWEAAADAAAYAAAAARAAQADAAASWAAEAYAAAAERAAQADAAASREAQARWIRDNFSLTDLNIN